MIPSCFALIGYLCVWNFGVGAESGAQTSILLTRAAFSLVADVRSAHWGARIYLRGFSRVGTDGLDPDAMQDACSEGKCIKYHRKCNSPTRPTACDYILMYPDQPQGFHVEGDSEQAFSVATTFLRVLANTNGDIIPISAMDHEASRPDPFRH